MLIPTHRLKPGDQETWGRLERYDHALYPGAKAKEQVAVDLITRWWEDTGRTGICSTSWGKDSTVTAHLTALTGLPIPIIWVRSDPYEPPESEAVRDVFLAAHLDVRYEERVATLRNPKRGEPGYEAHQLNPHRRHQDVLKELISEPYISGVRAEESTMRAKSARWHGTHTRHTCRPILHWSATDVFAYLAGEQLPVHPIYAMSYGGRLDRRWLRVHPLCSHHEESGVHGRDTASWEAAYYRDAIHTARALRLKSRAVGEQ